MKSSRAELDVSEAFNILWEILLVVTHIWASVLGYKVLVFGSVSVSLLYHDSHVEGLAVGFSLAWMMLCRRSTRRASIPS